MRISVRVLLAIVTLAALVTACGPAASPSATATLPTAVPPTKAPPSPVPPTPTSAPPTAVPSSPTPSGPYGTITVAWSEPIETLDPQGSLTIHCFNYSLAVYDSLVDIGDDGTILPRLATSWEMVDPTTWKFTLRQDVKFHNGRPFTSDDVKFTLDRIVDPATQSKIARFWGEYASTDTPDDYTAIIKTKTPMGTLLNNLAYVAILPAPQGGAAIDFATTSVGTGPFKLVDYQAGDHVTIEANVDYWGKVPSVKTIVDKWIPEETTRVSALEAGEVDFVWQLPQEESARLQAAGITVVEGSTFYDRFFWMNPQHKPFDDPRVRQAIRYGIDVSSMLQNLFAGEGVLSTGCIPQGVFGYCKVGDPWPYDPVKAKELLAEAGYPDGFTTTLKWSPGLPKEGEVTQVIAADLAKLGITVEIIEQDAGPWVDDLLALNWDMNMIGSATLTGDADFTLRRLYLSTNERTGYVNAELDQLLTAQAQELDRNKRAQELCDACKILWTDGPTEWFWTMTDLYGFDSKVKGFSARPNTFINYAELSVGE